MKAALPLLGVGLGVLLVAISLVWGLVFSSESGWTTEKSTKMAVLGDEVHLLMFKAAAAKDKPNMQGGENPAEVIATYKAKEEELAALQEEFNNIKDSPNTTAKYLRWSGIAFVLLGGAASMATREG
ncbi:MAG: hypothetical protein SH868_20540 [Bythopirellula sp.]|nr:hypothetical protein [Bythopirellula sp.]